MMRLFSWCGKKGGSCYSMEDFAKGISLCLFGGLHKWGTQNGWFIKENPIKKDPYFRKPSFLVHLNDFQA